MNKYQIEYTYTDNVASKAFVYADTARDALNRLELGGDISPTGNPVMHKCVITCLHFAEEEALEKITRAARTERIEAEYNLFIEEMRKAGLQPTDGPRRTEALDVHGDFFSVSFGEYVHVRYEIDMHETGEYTVYGPRTVKEEMKPYALTKEFSQGPSGAYSAVQSVLGFLRRYEDEYFDLISECEKTIESSRNALMQIKSIRKST